VFQSNAAEKEADFTRQAQVLAERQARMRALRNQYELEERRLRQEELDLRRQGSGVVAINPETELRSTMVSVMIASQLLSWVV